MDQSKEDLIRANALLSKQLIDKYRSMPGITSEEMIRAHIRSPRFSYVVPEQSPRTRLTNPISNSPQRTRYCDLCLTDRSTTSSAWIRYNERRIEDLQKRIDLMLKIDDEEEAKLLLEPVDSIRLESNKPVKTRIDDLILGKTSFQSDYATKLDQYSKSNKINLITSRINEHKSARSHQSLPTTPRSSRSNTRSTTPALKSVRIQSPSQYSLSSSSRRASPSSNSRTITSILRRTTAPQATPSTTMTTIDKPPTAHVWRSRVDGKIYVLEQFNIPRYYRLYNDVNFREIYNLSRVLDNCSTTNQNNIENYSSMMEHFQLEQPINSTLTTTA